VARFVREYRRPRVKDVERYRANATTVLKRALPLLGQKPAPAVTAEDIEQLMQSLSSSYSPSSVRTVLVHLGAMYSWANRLKLISGNPLRGVERPALTPSVEYLSGDEVKALLARLATDPTLPGRMLHACVHTALHTGLRRGELFGLRWQDLDLGARRLSVARSFLRTPKSGKTRHLRLAAAAAQVLADWRPLCPRTAENVVFPVVTAEPRMGGRTDQLGLGALLLAISGRELLHPWHALRHTFASHFLMSGGSIVALQQLLGHAEVTTTMVYAHLSADFLGTEIDRLKF
jgi:site-specific recombinase XerD